MTMETHQYTHRSKCFFHTLILFFLIFSPHSISQTAPHLKIDNPEGNGEIFLAGVYIYKDSETWTEEIMNAHLRSLSQLGINLIHINSFNVNGSTDEKILDYAKDYNLKILKQIDSAYYTGSITQAKIDAAVEQINGHINNQEIIAYSVREEPSESGVDGLMEYYEDIETTAIAQSGDSNVKFYLINNSVSASDKIKNIYSTNNYLPEITGADRYPFFWTFTSDIGYIATPQKAFELLNSTDNGLPAFTDNLLSNQNFIGVITANNSRITKSKTELKEWVVENNKCTQQEVDNNNCGRYNRWIDLANDNNQGLSHGTAPDDLLAWQYYRPPQHAMSAQVWLAIANGSQAIMVWNAQPKKSSTAQFSGLMGDDGKGHRTLSEYTKTVRELQKFGWLINRLESETSLASLQPSFQNQTGQDAKLIERSFEVDGYNGKIVLIVNTLIGLWDGGTKSFLSDTDNFHIDDDGELSSTDYIPSEAQTIDIEPQSLSAGESVYDVATGDLISSGATGSFDIEPGKGAILFVGTLAERDTLRDEMGITSTLPLVGSLLTDLQQPEHERLIYPVDPLVASTTHVIDEFLINNLTKRYRLHISASGIGGATLSAKLEGLDGASQPLIKNIGLTSETLTNDIKNFVSDDFILSDLSFSEAYLVLYRENQQGEVTVIDAWLEDISSQKNIASYYYINYSKKLNPNQAYKIFIDAKKLEGEDTTMGVKYLAYNSSHQQVGSGNLISWGTSLTSELQRYESSQFTVTHQDADYIRIAFYKANHGSNPGNTLVIKKAWAEEVN